MSMRHGRSEPLMQHRARQLLGQVCIGEGSVSGCPWQAPAVRCLSNAHADLSAASADKVRRVVGNSGGE